MEQEYYIPADLSMEALQNGDERAFEAVFQHYYKAMRFLAKRLTDDDMVAEEIAAGAFVKLWNKRRNFPDIKSVQAFLYICTRNESMNHVAALKRKNKHLQAYTDLIDTSEDKILGDIYRTEVMQHIYAAIEQLPDKYGQIIKMAYIEGKKNAEIARELGVPQSTVNTQKSRGLEMLKKNLPKGAFLLLLALFP